MRKKYRILGVVVMAAALLMQQAAPAVAASKIHGKRIKDGTITGAKLVNGTITGVKIADGTITGVKIADGTVTGADVDESTLGQVPTAGDAGNASNLEGRPASSFDIATEPIDLPIGVVSPSSTEFTFVGSPETTSGGIVTVTVTTTMSSVTGMDIAADVCWLPTPTPVGDTPTPFNTSHVQYILGGDPESVTAAGTADVPVGADYKIGLCVKKVGGAATQANNQGVNGWLLRQGS